MLFGLLTACADQKTVLVTKTVIVQAELPADLLFCPVQPPAPAMRTQKDAAIFMVQLAEAGAACRSKLMAVAELYRTLQVDPE